MNRFSIAMLFTLASVSGAVAHGGHIAFESGHSHWIAVVAAVLAVAISVGGFVLRFKKQRAR